MKNSCQKYHQIKSNYNIFLVNFKCLKIIKSGEHLQISLGKGGYEMTAKNVMSLFLEIREYDQQQWYAEFH